MKSIMTQNQVTTAEATIAWFYSGKQQPVVYVTYRFPFNVGCLSAVIKALKIGNFAALQHGGVRITATKGN
jgi:hypothetical protein